MRKHAGFTLIEVMIAVAIVAILATVAYPAYSDYVIRSALAEPRTALSDMRVRMEQYFQDNRTYVGADVPPAPGAPTPCTGPSGLSARFIYSCVPGSLTATAYAIQAVGAATNVTGFTFTVARTAANEHVRATPAAPGAWGPAQPACWIVRKGGQCQ